MVFVLEVLYFTQNIKQISQKEKNKRNVECNKQIFQPSLPSGIVIIMPGPVFLRRQSAALAPKCW